MKKDRSTPSAKQNRRLFIIAFVVTELLTIAIMVQMYRLDMDLASVLKWTLAGTLLNFGWCSFLKWMFGD